MPRWSPIAAALVALASMGSLTACSDPPARSPERFCRLVAADRDVLVTVVHSPTEATNAMARYRAIGDAAPEAVRDEWATLVQLLQAADDPATSDAALAERALASKTAIETIVSYVRDTCSVDLLSPPSTTAPSTSAPAGDAPSTSAPSGDAPANTTPAGNAATTTATPPGPTGGGGSTTRPPGPTPSTT